MNMNEFDDKHSYPHPIYVPPPTITPLRWMVFGIILLVCFIVLVITDCGATWCW